MANIESPALRPQPDLTGQLRRQAVELEGVFLNTLVKEMFASVGSGANEFGGGFAVETWRDMQAEQLASAMAEAGGVGLAEALLPDLLAMQEAAQHQFALSHHGVYR